MARPAGRNRRLGLRGLTTWYEVVAEKATRRESPLISISHSELPVSAYNTLYINMLRVASAALAAGIVTAGLVLSAQDAQDAFEVASVKVRTGERSLNFPPQAPDRFIRVDTTLQDLVLYAYDLRQFQFDGGPAWMRSSRFDVSAKAAGAPSTTMQMRAMVKRLLQERFNLKAHIEKRDQPIFEMVLARRDGKLGEKLKASSIDCDEIIRKRGPVPPPVAGGELPQCSVRFRSQMTQTATGMNVMAMTMFAEGTSMARLAVLFQNEARRIIVDKTGLTGTFDVELEFQPQTVVAVNGLSATPSGDGPTLFTALQEQLGLKLESARGPVDVLVVDSADLPTPD